MDKEFSSQYLLNDVLRNINSDIVTLRKDFKKLSELVIVLSVKIEETKSIKSELSAVLAKIDFIANKIFDLEKAKEKLEFLIHDIDTSNKNADVLVGVTNDQKLRLLDSKIVELTQKIPILKKIITALFVMIGILVYITESTAKFVDITWSIVKKMFWF